MWNNSFLFLLFLFFYENLDKDKMIIYTYNIFLFILIVVELNNIEITNGKLMLGMLIKYKLKWNNIEWKFLN